MLPPHVWLTMTSGCGMFTMICCGATAGAQFEIAGWQLAGCGAACCAIKAEWLEPDATRPEQASRNQLWRVLRARGRSIREFGRE